MLTRIGHVLKTLLIVGVYNQDVVAFQGSAGRVKQVSMLGGGFLQWNFFWGDFKFIRVVKGGGIMGRWKEVMLETLAYQGCLQSGLYVLFTHFFTACVCNQHVSVFVRHTLLVEGKKAKLLEGYLSRRLRNNAAKQLTLPKAYLGQVLGGCSCVHHTPCTCTRVSIT